MTTYNANINLAKGTTGEITSGNRPNLFVHNTTTKALNYSPDGITIYDYPTSSSVAAGLSAVQSKINTLSATKANNYTISENQLAVGGTNVISGSNRLTFDDTTLGIGVSANINDPKLYIIQNPGQAGGAEIFLGAAGTSNDENSGKIRFQGNNRLIGMTNAQLKHQVYNNTTSAWETIWEKKNSNTADKEIAFAGAVSLSGFGGSARVLVSNSAKQIVESSFITETELNYLDGVSANIQTQLENLSGSNSITNNRFNSYLPLSGGTLTGVVNIESSAFAQLEVGKAGTGGVIAFARPGDGVNGAYSGYQDSLSNDEFRDSVVSSNTVYRTWHLRNGANITGREVMRLHNSGGLSIGTSADPGIGGLNVAGAISATSISVGSIDNTEFNYLNGTSANIQNQLSNLSATKLTLGTNAGGDLGGTYPNPTVLKIGGVAVALSTEGPLYFNGSTIQSLANISADSYTDTNFVGSRILVSNNKIIDESSISTATLSNLVTSSHTHSNKSTLDLINQSLNTSANVNFRSINISAQSPTIFTASVPPNYIGQTMANSDNWKIYGESYDGDNGGALVFEVGDDGTEAFIWTSRNSDLTRNELLFLDYNGLYSPYNIETIGSFKKNVYGNIIEAENTTLANISQTDTINLAGTSNANRAIIRFGHQTSGGTLNYNGTSFVVDKDIVITGSVFSTYNTFDTQSITTTTNWDSKAVKIISNTGSAYTITLPTTLSNIPFYVTTSTLSNTVTVQRSGSDLIHLNGASGVTSITLAANTYYNVIYQAGLGKWYFKS